MIAPLKFVAGFSTNALIQSFRCLWNLLSCLVSLIFAATCLIAALLQWAGGGKDQAKRTLLASLAGLKGFLKLGPMCLLQGLALITFASPLMRAAQACSESARPNGVLTPRGIGRTPVQQMLGLNSWARDREPAPERKARAIPPKPKAKAPPPKPKAKTPPPKSNGAQGKPTTKKPERDRSDPSWGLLVEQYLNARTMKEMNRIRNKMAAGHPRKYLHALSAAKKYGSRKRAA